MLLCADAHNVILSESLKSLKGTAIHFYPTALQGSWGIVFTHGVQMGGRAVGKRLSGLYLRNRKV